MVALEEDVSCSSVLKRCVCFVVGDITRSGEDTCRYEQALLRNFMKLLVVTECVFVFKWPVACMTVVLMT